MKLILILLSLLLVNNTCSKTKIDQNAVSIEYTANSRGSFKHISITKKRISLVNKRDVKPISKECNQASWNKLMKIFKDLDIKNIPNLEAPSKKRFFDGAAIARLKITCNGTVYETPSFDHGNPHKDITNLVNEIMSIYKNNEWLLPIP
ncbi:hypothetical protein A8C32_11475 [Flavivirga aquatica]|uniref:Uncharacterized protein n=1 Tax=Flavivirga aquatica TaxID=1849968 RepID=A0A1E5TD87_9FLAO|nr:hypothetical protein [Flavivirga aquatica]OEK09335.1 hypothetical protein A8C32_11475 [Flavivirga aquatica]